MLPEADEHVRELGNDEANKLVLVVRSDNEPFLAFARATGLRLKELSAQVERGQLGYTLNYQERQGRSICHRIYHG
jgi:hypothetical protein